MNSLQEDIKLYTLLKRLHARSTAQNEEIQDYIAVAGSKSIAGTTSDMIAGRVFWQDKLVALDQDKAQFCYHLCRAMSTRKAVEIGTSYGVSTLYLAAAIRDNGGGTVIATEYESIKATAARAHFLEAGLVDQIDLREGDLRQTLQSLPHNLDFVLMDIWLPMVHPALEIIDPYLRPGAVIIADNTESFRKDYTDFFTYLKTHKYTTQTLPFEGGLEMSIKLG
ncbi:O-methyltransferase [Candidatus Nitrosacidococcus tergens]|uniref:Methyltransferase n=1 Tax=Candidatus Nitrosacidococcus tergens TaxID=553981 RepID=A0A7G1Q7I2_9GAMM|nr:class I SAM-dependent methyltransferase [Candidatus Nitrosacidococcus tergens]CAB1274309.1 conserved protein of unknown function [Candidatus Nitrosacidococcus tergens]